MTQTRQKSWAGTEQPSFYREIQLTQKSQGDIGKPGYHRESQVITGTGDNHVITGNSQAVTGDSQAVTGNSQAVTGDTQEATGRTTERIRSHRAAGPHRNGLELSGTEDSRQGGNN